MMNHLSIVILAAGNGKRMHSKLPKVLHPLAGVPMLERVVNTAAMIQPRSILVVYGNHGSVPRRLKQLKVEWVHQDEPLGTAHAVLQALPYINDDQSVLILYGDVPLISADTISKLIQTTPKDALGLVVARFDNPQGFGRIVRNGQNQIIKIIEEKDTTESEKSIQEINTGIMLIPAGYLKKFLPQISNQNAQKEYYLTDIISKAKEDGYDIHGISAQNPDEVRGANTLKELIYLERVYQRRTAYKYLDLGVTIKDPDRFDLRGTLEAKEGVVIDVNAVLEGKIELGAGTYIGPNTYLKDVKIGERVEIKPNCVIEEAIIGDDCVVGPFARIRPGTELAHKAKVGNFVEIKKTRMGENSKANHLTYLGDAVIGENVNIGAGVITCNYDGVNKYETQIEDNAFIGSDVQLVAPVTVHSNATVGAGSTITEDVPANTLAVARSRQIKIENWERGGKKRKDKE